MVLELEGVSGSRPFESGEAWGGPLPVTAGIQMQPSFCSMQAAMVLSLA